MSKRIIESMRNFKYFKKLHKTRKDSRSNFFARYFISKTPEKIEYKKQNANFVFKFSDYKSLNLETEEDIFINELQKEEDHSMKSKYDLNTFYKEKETNLRNINVMMNILNRNKKCRRYFKYNDINNELIKILLTYSTYKRYNKDAVIFKAGSKQSAFYYLIRGKISLKSMNNELIRKNVRTNKLKMESMYNEIKAEEKFKLQDISDDNISLDPFVSKTNLEQINFNANVSKLKAKLSLKSTSSKKNEQLIRRSKTRVTTLRLHTLEVPKNIVQEKILIENFHVMQKDLSATVKTYSQGDFFCDWEIILDKPHNETAYAEEDTDLLVLSKKYFDKYFSNHFIKTDNERKMFLTKRIEFLHINNVINLKPEFFDRGEVIYTKFDPANQFFVLYKGKGALMDLNDDYIYRKKSDVVFNSQDLKLLCYIGEGCVVGLESFNDGRMKYDNNFVIAEDNTIIYRIRMNKINNDNYLKKKNKMKLKKQLNEMYLSQNEMLPKFIHHKRLTTEEKIYKRKEEKLNDLFSDAKKYFLKKTLNEKRGNTVYGDINQITEMKNYLSEKHSSLRKTIKFSEKKLPSLDTEDSQPFKRRSKFHFMTTINKPKKRVSTMEVKEKEQFNILPFKNNLKNTLESMKSDKKESNLQNILKKNDNAGRKSIVNPKRFSMFSFHFKSNLFKDENMKINKNNQILETKEENYFDFYGDNNNDLFKTTNKKFTKKKLTSDVFDKYVSKTIKINKGDINYNSGNFRIPLFGSSKTKK